jgi:hypothetical protein
MTLPWDRERRERERLRTRKKTTATTRNAVINPTHRPALKMPPTAAQPAALTVRISASVRVWSQPNAAVRAEVLCAVGGLDMAATSARADRDGRS